MSASQEEVPESPERGLYPPSPTKVPELTTLTGAYRLRVVLVLVSLLLFLAIYLGLVFGSGYLVKVIWESPTPRDRGALLKFGGIAGCAMLFLFFLKGLFKRGSQDTEGYVEVREQQQPRQGESLPLGPGGDGGSLGDSPLHGSA